MSAGKPPLPPAWYVTVQALARRYDVHPDEIAYHIDSGRLGAVVRVPKGDLPMAVPGPAPHVCVSLPGYCDMDWQSDGVDRVAQLVGAFRVYDVCGKDLGGMELADADAVFARRSNLVLTETQQEELAIFATSDRPKAWNRTERHSIMRLFGVALGLAFPVDVRHPYKIAEGLRGELALSGDGLSVGAIVPKVKEALALLTEEQLAEFEEAA